MTNGVIEKPAIIQHIEKAVWCFELTNSWAPSLLLLGRSDYEQLVAACPAMGYQFNGKTFEELEVRQTELENELRVL